MKRMLKVSLCIFIGGLVFSVENAANYLVPYAHHKKDHLELNYQLELLNIKYPNLSVFSRNQVNIGANWYNFTYRFKAYYVKGSRTQFLHDFYWDALSFQFPYIKSKLDLQLALLNVGSPGFDYDGIAIEDLSKNNAYQNFITNEYYRELQKNNFLSDTFLKHLVINQRYQFFPRIPSYFYFSFFNTQADHSVFRSAYGLAYETDKHVVALEYDPKIETMIARFKMHLSSFLSIETQYNTSSEVYQFDAKDSPEKMFAPKYIFSLSFKTPIVPKKKTLTEKARLAKQIDEETLLNLEKGLIAYYEQDFDRALKHYLIVVERDKYLVIGHIRLGDIYFQLELYEKAKISWKKALFIDPGNPKAILGLQKIEEVKLQQGF